MHPLLVDLQAQLAVAERHRVAAARTLPTVPTPAGPARTLVGAWLVRLGTRIQRVPQAPARVAVTR